MCNDGFHVLTSVSLCQTLLLGFDESDGVVVFTSLGAPVNSAQILHVPVLRFHLPPQARVPPGPPVLRQSSEQRGQDAAVRVGEVLQAGQGVGGGGGERREAAGERGEEEEEERDGAETTSGHQCLFSHHREVQNKNKHK